MPDIPLTPRPLKAALGLRVSDFGFRVQGLQAPTQYPSPVSERSDPLIFPQSNTLSFLLSVS